MLTDWGCLTCAPFYCSELARWAGEVETCLLVRARGVPLDARQPIEGRGVEGGRVRRGARVLCAGVSPRPHQINLRTEHGSEVVHFG